ncbi:MAG: RNA polymerase sigma factor SigM [Actinomycetes bacterium]
MPPEARRGPVPTDDGPDDRELMAAHVAGDADAFTELVRRHQPRLWAVAVRTLGNREDAADALQDALVSAYRNAASYRGDAAVTTWLHRIVVNACLDRVRRARSRPTAPLPETDVPAPRDEHARAELRLDVRAALARLPEHQRVALVLVDMQGLPVAQVAEVLGVAEGTVKSRCARGRAALAELLRPGNRGSSGDVPPAAHPPVSPHPTAPGDPS